MNTYLEIQKKQKDLEILCYSFIEDGIRKAGSSEMLSLKITKGEDSKYIESVKERIKRKGKSKKTGLDLLLEICRKINHDFPS